MDVVFIGIYPESTESDLLKTNPCQRQVLNVHVRELGFIEGVGVVLQNGYRETGGGWQVIKLSDINRHGVLLCGKGNRVIHLEEEAGVSVTQSIEIGFETKFGDVGQGHDLAVGDFSLSTINLVVLIGVQPESAFIHRLETDRGEGLIFIAHICKWEITHGHTVDLVFTGGNGGICRSRQVIHSSNIDIHGVDRIAVGSTIVDFEVECGVRQAIFMLVSQEAKFRDVCGVNFDIVRNFNFAIVQSTTQVSIEPKSTSGSSLESNFGDWRKLHISVGEIRKLNFQNSVFRGGDRCIRRSWQVIHRRNMDIHGLWNCDIEITILYFKIESCVVGSVFILVGTIFEQWDVCDDDHISAFHGLFAVVDGATVIDVVPKCTSGNWMHSNLSKSIVFNICVREISVGKGEDLIFDRCHSGWSRSRCVIHRIDIHG